MLIFDSEKSLENSIQLVAPSTAQILAEQIRNDPADKIIISGELMAGEPWHKEIYQKCDLLPESVIMTETAARSLRYDLDEVRSRGVKIVPDQQISNHSGSRYVLSDINWIRIEKVLQNSGISVSNITKVLICCQDHGEPEIKNQSTRDYRMKKIYGQLATNGKLEDLLFRSNEIDHRLPRLQSIVNSALNRFKHLRRDDVFVMDSSPAVALGAMQGFPKELIVNVGNGHTLAVFASDRIVDAIYEVHTGGVDPVDFINQLKQVEMGTLSHEKALQNGAHGVYYRNKRNKSKSEMNRYYPIVLIGPNREKLSSLKVIKVHPGGSMMMAGPMGLLRAYSARYSLDLL